MEELIKRLERVIQTGAPDKDGMHPISAETVLEVVKELSEHGTNLSEVGTDAVSRKAVKELAYSQIRSMYCGVALKEQRETMLRIADNVIGLLAPVTSAQPATSCSEFPNNSDTISRQAAIDAIDECYCGGEDSCGEPWIYKENAVEAIEMVEPSPSAEPKRGKWILDRSGAYCCSECMEPCAGYVMMKPRDKFCKMCGSRNEVTT